ncbi:MAG: hypothetical protein HY918_03430 [Candidatus Doudnabacteria bacterium]|nr:hypothetical protein [Candidatus Doudnabacteria bacterium]
MYTYRITKYNPKNRNKNGIYLKDDWTDFSDIGKKINGKIFTLKQYLKVENSYIQTILSFLSGNEILSMRVEKIQNFKKIKYRNKVVKKNQVYKLADLKELLKLVLRGLLWCKFKNKNGCYLDFGGDYYVYIGVLKESSESIIFAKKQKLFVEPYIEPALD